jgi:hypothetical protein
MPSATTNCRNEGCSQPAKGGKGYCRRHYNAWKRGALPKARFKTCRVEGCHKRIAARGRCEEHVARDYPGKRPAQPAEAASPTPAQT